jgi:hypothetical protein
LRDYRVTGPAVLKTSPAVLKRLLLQGARLPNANLVGAMLDSAILAGANLRGANLQAADLEHADLSGTDLRSARFDQATQLTGAILDGVAVDQITLNGVNLTGVSWKSVTPLKDEQIAREQAQLIKPFRAAPVFREASIEHYEAALRANRLVATALRAQGMTEDADLFLFRAQLMQRELCIQRGKYGQWIFSLFVEISSGYGYRPLRIVGAYGLVLTVFAAIFWALGIHSFAAEPGWQALWDSFLVSLSAIHGRATFETLGAWTPAAWVAAVESVIGIVIEGVFVAMLIQRLFR